MTQRENLYAYTEQHKAGVPYVGYVSLNREPDGNVTLSVRSPGDPAQATTGTITLPHHVMVGLAGALKHDGAGLAGAGG